MKEYQKPTVEFVSFQPEECIMDDVVIGGGDGVGTSQGGGLSPFSLDLTLGE